MATIFSFTTAIYNQNQRKFIAMVLTLLMALLSNFMLIKPTYAAEKETQNNTKKTLIVYYSRSGNTEAIAQYIRNQIGADSIKLETVTPYPEQYRATTIQARMELNENFYPELKTKINNLSDYDTILIGSPNWWGTVSMPIRTFLHESNLSGKNIALFITHEGSGFGQSLSDIKNFQPKANLLDAIAIRGNDATDSQLPIQQWLTKIGLNKSN